MKNLPFIIGLFLCLIPKIALAQPPAPAIGFDCSYVVITNIQDGVHVHCQPMPSPSPTPSSTPTAVPTASPTIAPTATPVPTPSPTVVPTPVATITASPAPPTPSASPTNVALIYDPPAGVATYFPDSPFRKQIPNPPVDDPNSAIWAKVYTTNKIDLACCGAVDPTAYPTAEQHDYGFPFYIASSSGPLNSNFKPFKIHCTEKWGTCNVEGKTIWFDPRSTPEDGAKVGADSHCDFIDTAGEKEYILWGCGKTSGAGTYATGTTWPPIDGNLDISWGGACDLTGNGFTPTTGGGCAGDATSTPLSMGMIRAQDLMYGLKDPVHGSLPNAIAMAVNCNGLPPALSPFLGSDGRCSGQAPEGAHFYLALHDADVNKLNLAPLTAVIIRTLDEDHYGGFPTDSNSTTADGSLHLVQESDETYESFGLPGPWLTQYIPEAIKEGLWKQSQQYQGRDIIDLPIPASLGQYVHFLKSP